MSIDLSKRSVEGSYADVPAEGMAYDDLASEGLDSLHQQIESAEPGVETFNPDLREAIEMIAYIIREVPGNDRLIEDVKQTILWSRAKGTEGEAYQQEEQVVDQVCNALKMVRACYQHYYERMSEKGKFAQLATEKDYIQKFIAIVLMDRLLIHTTHSQDLSQALRQLEQYPQLVGYFYQTAAELLGQDSSS